MLTAMTLMVLGAWPGAELEVRDDCVAVTNVWPNGPAAAGGLVDGDCLKNLLLNGGSVERFEAAEKIRAARKGSVLKAKTAAGKSVTLKLTEPTKETKLEFCEWLHGRRIKIDVMLLRGCKPRGGGTVSYEVSAPPAVAELRKRFDAKGDAVVVLRSCAAEEKTVRGPDAETLVLTSDAKVDFDELPNVQIIRGAPAKKP